MAQLPAALKARMHRKGHIQEDVEAITGVSQPQISKALKGRRKRLTEPMRRLCQYASIEIRDEAPADLELARLLQQVIEVSPAAAECVRDILRGLVTLLESHKDGSKHR